MLKVILTRGLPAAGKTKFAKELIDKYTGQYKRVNKDDLRSMLDNGRWSKDNEKFVLKIRDEIILTALNEGKHVIVDDTNFSDTHYNRISQLIKDNKINAFIEYKDFTDVPIEVCIKNDLKRFNSVGEEVIRKMYNDYLRPKVSPPPYNPSLPHCIIVDIDGTLAINNSGRSPYDWSRVGEDTIKSEIVAIVDYFSQDHTKIIVVSGRDEVCREETKLWLERNEVWFNELYMRPEGNNEKDTIIKERIYREHIEGKYNVDFVLDDRSCVIEMWRNTLGLTCLQVAEGDF